MGSSVKRKDLSVPPDHPRDGGEGSQVGGCVGVVAGTTTLLPDRNASSKKGHKEAQRKKCDVILGPVRVLNLGRTGRRI